jgi:hypothetical protein
MITSIDLKLLRQIMQHLLNNPGEFQWNHYCSIRNIEVIDLHSHLQWLRQNGFTRNQEGKTYRTDRPINELAIALGLVTDSPKPIVARSLGYERRSTAPKPVETVAVIQPPPKADRPKKTVAQRNPKPKAIKPPPKVDRLPKDPSPRRSMPMQPPKAIRITPQSELLLCAQQLQKIQFWRLPVWDLSNRLFAECEQRYSTETIEAAVQQIPKISIEWYSHESFPRYSHRLP